MKVQIFQKRGSVHANINEPPETILQRLRLVTQDINSMAVNQDSVPISSTMLRMKFLEIMLDIPQYKQAIGILNLQVKEDVNGNPIPLSLDEYTKKLQIIFLEAKESSFRQRVLKPSTRRRRSTYCTNWSKIFRSKIPSCSKFSCSFQRFLEI